MQLISIHTTPLKWSIQTQPARLEMKQADNADIAINQKDAKISIHSRNIQIQLDTTEMRRSMGLRDISAVLEDEAAKGREAAQQAVAEFSRFGTQMGRIADGVTIAQLVTQKIMEQPDTITAFIPSVGPDISWIPAEANLEYIPGELSTDWKVNRNLMEYIPGKFEFIIDQYPDITIQWLGQPNYFPVSAKPGV